MPKYGYLVVEGPHDVEFAYRLLAPLGLKRVKKDSDLDAYFADLVPRSFPHGGDLQKRVPVPLFLQSQTHAIAIHSAVGDNRLTATIEENAVIINYEELTGIGILLDTDWEIPAEQRYKSLSEQMATLGYRFPELAGRVSSDAPKLGAFVLPDNSSKGNLEDLLIECAETAFPSLLNSARTHVENARQDPSFNDENREDLNLTPNFNKAVIGAIATTLRPGRAVQTSIQDNIWLREANLQLPRIKAVQEFLIELFNLEESSLA